jgi:hypothetical protein
MLVDSLSSASRISIALLKKRIKKGYTHGLPKPQQGKAGKCHCKKPASVTCMHQRFELG